jgi:hypothetical protein
MSKVCFDVGLSLDGGPSSRVWHYEQVAPEHWRI